MVSLLHSFIGIAHPSCRAQIFITSTDDGQSTTCPKREDEGSSQSNTHSTLKRLQNMHVMSEQTTLQTKLWQINCGIWRNQLQPSQILPTLLQSLKTSNNNLFAAHPKN